VRLKAWLILAPVAAVGASCGGGPRLVPARNSGAWLDTVTAQPPGGTRLRGDSVHVEGLVVEAVVTVVRSRLPAVFEPVVTVTNRGPDSVRVMMDGGGCMFILQVRAAAQPAGPLVYPPECLPDGGLLGCLPLGRDVVLPPQTSRKFAPPGARRAIPAPGIPVDFAPGRYYLSVRFALGGTGGVELPVGLVTLTR